MPALLLIVVSLFNELSAPATPPAIPEAAVQYVKSEAMIPMRDGIKLYTQIYAPQDQQDEKMPILFLRTPYGVTNPDGEFTTHFATTFRELAPQRYLIVVQDARGRHKSEGKFIWNRPVTHRDEAESVDESTDAYDSIEWLVNNVPHNNGHVGMLGVSYPGWYVAMALVDPHPALKAASPQASPSDYFMGDDFFHNGAFRLSPSAELPYLFDFDPKANAKFPYDQVDVYEFFLDLGPLSQMNERYMKNASPTWNSFMAHSTYDEFWEAGCTLPQLTAVTVPTLNVVGWWDAENLGGALDLYARLESLDQRGLNQIVVGPWFHGQWSRGPGDRLGEYEFGGDLTAHYQQKIEAPFFARWLKDETAEELPEATMFQTGSNVWKTYDAWPPRVGVEPKKLFFHADGELTSKPPVADEKTFVAYVSDPAKPVPYSKRPIQGFWQGLKDSHDPRFDRAGRLWKVEDQRFVSDRPDVLSFTTEPLADDVELTGAIVAKLFAATTGTDADWVVKLIDVYPEDYPERPEMGGYQLMVADDVLRGKFRRSMKRPEPLNPGQVEEFTIDLRTRNHLFRKGHRIMVQIQSSWFPLIDRNPQTFVDIPQAKAEDYRLAEQRIYCSPEHPSQIEFSVALPKGIDD